MSSPCPCLSVDLKRPITSSNNLTWNNSQDESTHQTAPQPLVLVLKCIIRYVLFLYDRWWDQVNNSFFVVNQAVIFIRLLYFVLLLHLTIWMFLFLSLWSAAFKVWLKNECNRKIVSNQDEIKVIGCDWKNIEWIIKYYTIQGRISMSAFISWECRLLRLCRMSNRTKLTSRCGIDLAHCWHEL